MLEDFTVLSVFKSYFKLSESEIHVPRRLYSLALLCIDINSFKAEKCHLKVFAYLRSQFLVALAIASANISASTKN